jgi:hypothetical protein
MATEMVVSPVALEGAKVRLEAMLSSPRTGIPLRRPGLLWLPTLLRNDWTFGQRPCGVI